MKEKRRVKMGLWDIVAAVLAVLLLLNALVFCIFCMASIGLAFDPVLAFLTGVELLLGLVFLPLTKRLRVSRLWRRLLTAGVVCSALVIAFLCVTALIMLAVWQ